MTNSNYGSMDMFGIVSSRANAGCKYAFSLALVIVFFLSGTGSAHALSASIAYQPMVSTGLAAGQDFEAWIVLDKPLEPNEPGYAVPSGATMRFTFPKAFRPLPDMKPKAVLLYGWPQKPIPVKFEVALDSKDPRTIVITLLQSVEAAPPDRPSLKAIHLRTGEVNPAREGKYPIEIRFANAGELSGAATAIASITKSPVPNVAAYNQLHNGRNEDWQHAKRGETASIPIDLLITLPREARSSLSLHSRSDGSLEILSDERPIGAITASGVPLTLKPESFGPGFARLGVVRFQATAGTAVGTAEITARVTGGTSYTLRLIVE
jgi:hypothetical protein